MFDQLQVTGVQDPTFNKCELSHLIQPFIFVLFLIASQTDLIR